MMTSLRKVIVRRFHIIAESYYYLRHIDPPFVTPIGQEG